MKVKTECEKSKDSMEMLAFFNKLPDKTHEELLSQLCLQGDPRASTASESQPKKNLEEYMSEMDNASNADKSRLYDEFIKTQHKRHLTVNIWARFPLFKLNQAFNSLLLLARIEILVKLKLFFAIKIAVLIRSLASRQETM